MIVNCRNCDEQFDDARRSTICPHRKLMPDEDMNRKIEALALMDLAQGKTVQFHGQTGPGYRLQSVGWNGMVTIEGMAGEFAPHLFYVVTSASDIQFKEATMASSDGITTSYKKHSSNRITQDDLDNQFTYHAPKGDQTERYLALRVAAKMLAEKIVDYCPPSADTTAAVRLLSEAIMTANASIARGE